MATAASSALRKKEPPSVKRYWFGTRLLLRPAGLYPKTGTGSVNEAAGARFVEGRAASGRLAGDDGGDYGQGTIDGDAVYVKVRDHADGTLPRGSAENPLFAESADDFRGGLAGWRHVENQNIGDNLFRIDRDAGDSGQALGQMLGVFVVYMQALRRFLKRDESCGGEHPRLAHSAAQQLARNPGFVDKIARAHQDRANRRAESFRQAEHPRIEFLRDLGNGFSQRGCHIENSRAVQMHGQAGGVGAVADVVGNRRRIDRAAVHVVRVFEFDQSCLRAVIDV